MADVWSAVAAIAAVISLVGILQAVFIRLTIGKAIAENNATLLSQINGTYIRRSECVLSHKDLVHRLERLEDMGD